jgi:hypothetical protein
MTRWRNQTVKIETAFGSVFVHGKFDDAGRLGGLSISTAGKDPRSGVSRSLREIARVCNDLVGGDPEDVPDAEPEIEERYYGGDEG